MSSNQQRQGVEPWQCISHLINAYSAASLPEEVDEIGSPGAIGAGKS